MEAIGADHVICRPGQALSPGWVGIEKGAIHEVGEGAPPRELHAVEGGAGSILLAGLVSAHSHLALGHLRHVADDREFWPWLLEGIMPAIREANADPSLYLAGARRSARELLAGGVTLVGDNFLRPDGVQALRETGQKGTFFQEVFGSLAPDDDTYIARTGPELDALATTLVDYPFGYSPHTPWSCPPNVFRWIAERARREGRRLSYHLDESAEEHALFTDNRGPLSEMIRTKGQGHRYRFGLTPTQLVYELGGLGPHVVVAHAVQVTDEDIRLLADTGTSVAHCPTSNMKLAEGIAPVRAMLEAGVNVALGVDSAASTGKLDLFEEMRLFVYAQRGRDRRVGAVDARAALHLATLGGARALGVEHQTGSLEPGKAADLIMLRADRLRHGPIRDPEAAVVYTGTPDDVALVLVDGVELLRRGLGA